MYIGKKDLLPNNTKLNWEECYAKIVLEEVIDKNYKKLEMKDKPDLQNDDLDVGIECTISIPSNQLEAENLFSELMENKSRNPSKTKKRIKDKGGNIQNDLLCQRRDVNISNIKEVVVKKLKKLNGCNYRIFKNNYLLIRDDIIILENQVKDLQNEIQFEQNKYEKRFSKIYILLCKKIIELDMINNTNREICFDNNEQFLMSIEARKMAINNENKLEKNKRI